MKDNISDSHIAINTCSVTRNKNKYAHLYTYI